MVDQDKPVLLITGASAGIGDGIARYFAERGYRIVAVARRADKLEALKKDLAGTTEVEIFAGDVSDPDVPTNAVALAMSKFGRLDVLINNAGSAKWMPVAQCDDEVLEEVIAISIRGPFRFSREALKVMKAGSCILNISSTYALIGGMNGGAYSVAKAGLVGLTTTMAADYGTQGIRSNMVAPGVVRTDMTDAAWDLPFFQRLNQEMTPIDRDCTVEDVAATCFFLASKEGSFINGQNIAVDGGWSTTKYLGAEALTWDRIPPKG
jgi:3-oxoacyl-[acyl-carrier protein] reductase